MAAPGEQTKRTKGGGERQVAACSIVGLVLALAVAGWFLTREPQLSDHAARVTNVTHYAWIDDHQLLWAMPGSAHLSRLDLRTRNQQLLDTLNAAADTKKWITETPQSVAPGGRRALSLINTAAPDRYGGQPDPRTTPIELDGRMAGESDAGVSPVWLPDGRRWLALGPTARNRFADTEPTSIWLYSADAPNRKVGPMPMPKPVRSLLGVTPDYRLVMTDLPTGIDRPFVTIWQRGIYLNSAPERQATLLAPSGWFYRGAALSPSGDRIAWLLTSARVPALLAFVGRLLPGLVKNLKATRTFQIRTSRIDGADVREIGFQDAGKDNQGKVSDLKWNPDGKRVSFVYRDSLIIVPVTR